jgi:hypothetical protein
MPSSDRDSVGSRGSPRKVAPVVDVRIDAARRGGELNPGRDVTP